MSYSEHLYKHYFLDDFSFLDDNQNNQKIIEDLKKENKTLKSENKNLKAKIKKLENKLKLIIKNIE